MATPITIAAYIAQALTVNPSYRALEATLRMVVLAGCADDLGRVIGTTSDGTAISLNSAESLMNAIDMCRRFAAQDEGPQTINFEPGISGSSSGWNS